MGITPDMLRTQHELEDRKTKDRADASSGEMTDLTCESLYAALYGETPRPMTLEAAALSHVEAGLEVVQQTDRTIELVGRARLENGFATAPHARITLTKDQARALGVALVQAAF